MILEELRRLGTWQERHRRLFSRLLLVLALTAVVDGIGTLPILPALLLMPAIKQLRERFQRAEQVT